MSEHRAEGRSAAAGVAAALGAYAIWGVIPLYFKQLGHVDPGLILAHRTLWSLALLVAIVATAGGVGRVRAMLGDERVRRVLPVTAAMLATNWLLFVVCIVTDRVLQASLAYYLTPLAMAGLGALVLGERPRRLQIAGIAVAGVGVATLVWASGELPWMALVIAGSWSIYGLLRRSRRVPSLAGLTAELALLSPIAAGWMLFAGPLPTASPNAASIDLLILAAGCLVTASPLLLFGAAATRVRLATLGFMQYLAPTLQLLIGTLVYGEPFGWRRGIAFGLIWLAIVVYSLDAVRHVRRSRRS